MNYLLDKKLKRNRYLKAIFGLAALILLFYFRSGVFEGLSYAAGTVFSPVLVVGSNIGEKFGNIGSYFSSKSSLYSENQELRSQISREEARMSNYDSLFTENEDLKEILGRTNAKENRVLAAILAKPNQSAYDTLVIDAGKKEGILEGDRVFALGNIPVGRVQAAYEDSSKVVLFSGAGERTQAFISGKNVSSEIVGRGGGNFEITMPKDFVLEIGDQLVLPGINPYLLAVVEKIISDPRGPSTRALLVSPVNIQELKFVEVSVK